MRTGISSSDFVSQWSLRGGPIPSDSFTGLISYSRLLSCRPFDGFAVGRLVRG